MSHQLHCGDSAELLKQYPDCHFDSIITDPPYGIEFLGKEWDQNTGALEIWQECFRVLKPGGYLLAFSAARTYHHLATRIESVGFEIRDQLMWIYSSGFPKAQDMGKAIDKRAGKKDKTVLVAPTYGVNGEKIVSNSPSGQLRCPVCKKTSEQRYHCGKGEDCGMVYKAQTPQAKQWAGWKTALKPAHEPIVMARRPFRGSTIDNIQQHGVGALNIDATRIPFQDAKDIKSAQFGRDKDKTFGYINTELQDTRKRENMIVVEANAQGRYPSNVLGDIPDYQKYFYSPKVSRRERHCGFDTNIIKHDERHKERTDNEYFIKSKTTDGVAEGYRPQDKGGNNHPTVKPVALMRYLIQLVTPSHSRVLDPFMGSGTTGMAVRELGHEFVGCDLDSRYVEIAQRRIQGWLAEHRHTEPPHANSTYHQLFE
jgi:site-specific DNA-methyltransferase (adenine-specific)